MTQKLRDATLVFLVKKEGEEIREICLAMKKRGFGAGRWNGAGGKVEAGEGIVDGAIRETQEEIGVSVRDPKQVAELTFHFPHKPEWDQFVHAYFAERWEGEPAESEEMRPEWFSLSDIPYDDMWPTDPFWLPLVLSGKKVSATFYFGEGDTILNKEVHVGD